jgi:hypothetical protein
MATPMDMKVLVRKKLFALESEMSNMLISEEEYYIIVCEYAYWFQVLRDISLMEQERKSLGTHGVVSRSHFYKFENRVELLRYIDVILYQNLSVKDGDAGAGFFAWLREEMYPCAGLETAYSRRESEMKSSVAELISLCPAGGRGVNGVNPVVEMRSIGTEHIAPAATLRTPRAKRAGAGVHSYSKKSKAE